MYKILTPMQFALFANDISLTLSSPLRRSRLFMYLRSLSQRQNPCVIFLHQQCRRSNNFQRVLPNGNRTFFLEEIGKYCLLLSVFSSLFCNHVECSSYTNIYISNGYNLYISYIMLVKSIVESTMFKRIDDYLWA